MIVKTESDLSQALHLLRRGKIVAVDVETTGLNVRKDKVIGLGVAINESTGFYVKEYEHMHLIASLLQEKSLIAWNAYFDLEMIRNNFDVDLWGALQADVVCLKHTVDEEMPFGLKEVSKKLWGLDATKEQEELKASIKANGGAANEFYKADPEVLGKYCVQDCLLTIRLFNYYSRSLKEEGLESFFYEEEVMPLYKEVTRFMQSRGVPVDVEKATKLRKNIKFDMIELEQKIMAQLKPHLDLFRKWYLHKEYKPRQSGKFAQGVAEFGNLPLPQTKTGKYSLLKKLLEDLGNNRYAAFLRGEIFLKEAEVEQIQLLLYKKEHGDKPMFNLASKHHLKKLFFETLGETPVSKTEKGNPQVDDAFLDLMAKKYQWCAWLQDFNKLNKLKGAYLDRILDNHEDGIFYPAFQQHRTISGRFASDLQQMPRQAGDGQFTPLVTGYRNQIRDLFIAGSGHKLVGADYESLEPHIFAHVSGDKKIQEIFEKGWDFYSQIAIQTEKIEGVSADKNAENYFGKLNKAGRQKAKAYALGVPYGMESYALAKSLKIDQNEAESLIRKYKEGFPDLAKWMHESEKAVLKAGYITSQAGRKRRFPLAQKILKQYGINIVDSLYLYQEYHESPELYEKMKELRRKVKNALNNAKNFQIQSLAASITNRAAIKMNRWFVDNNINGYVCMNVHDELVTRVEEQDAKRTAEALQDIMENVYKLDVKLKAPTEIGDIYGSIK